MCPPEACSDNKGNNTEPAENLSQNESTKEPISMKDCMVKLDILSNDTIEHWTRYNLNSGGKLVYNLRDRHHNEKRQANRLHRNAKQHVSYAIDYSLTSSEDDDYSVCPGRWVKPRVKNIHVPLSGPSADRMAAQRMIDTARENTAAKALLELNRDNSINVQRSVTSNNISSSSDQDASSSSDSTQIVSSPEDCDEAHSSNCSTCSSSSSSDSSSDTDEKQYNTDADDDILLSELKKKLGSTNTSSSEDNLTLAEIKNNLPKTEPKAFFKNNTI